jgi:hypothetical protein
MNGPTVMIPGMVRGLQEHENFAGIKFESAVH